jgi:energy-coupling factor transporter ATP-binding protein EcfA2
MIDEVRAYYLRFPSLETNFGRVTAVEIKLCCNIMKVLYLHMNSGGREQNMEFFDLSEVLANLGFWRQKFNVLILGMEGSGKTTLFNFLSNDQFPPSPRNSFSRLIHPHISPDTLLDQCQIPTNRLILNLFELNQSLDGGEVVASHSTHLNSS